MTTPPALSGSDLPHARNARHARTTPQASTAQAPAEAADSSGPRFLFIVGAVAAGMVVPVQARLNSELSHRLDDGIAAAALNFTGGLILTTVLVVCFPRRRRALQTLATAVRQRRLPLRYLFAGVFGGTLALAQSTAALITGIAVFTMSVIAGQTLSGLIVDARGIGGGLKQRPDRRRLIGAAVVLVGALISAVPGLSSAPTPGEVLLPALVALGAGFLLGLQQALNGATGAAAGSPLAATWVSFCAGAIFLALAWGIKAIIQGVGGHPLPTDWWIYLGGLCGVLFIGASAFLVRRIGVLLLTMALIAGQLASSIALDLLIPSGSRSPGTLTVVGAILTFAAVWIASRRPHDEST
ncbi:transporter family-2 protein [Sinosporangium album]|uniref:Transporter family-2 protein n=1 Tax=Sinosporangium album TaxID=504805 RepID=A0A1G7QPK5_9ACTN|nr:DMT family transporter [Sinosporangium album]SDG00413.1 transporter family-2 protein [Sinosporangium album]